jgi:hypothetical protein
MASSAVRGILKEKSEKMAKRDTFLLRVDKEILLGVKQWAEDELRSMNHQIEYLIRQALKNHNRLPSDLGGAPSNNSAGDENHSASE